LEGNAQPRLSRQLVGQCAFRRSASLLFAGSESKRVVSYTTKIRPLRLYLLRSLAKLGRRGCVARTDLLFTSPRWGEIDFRRNSGEGEPTCEVSPPSPASPRSSRGSAPSPQWGEGKREFRENEIVSHLPQWGEGKKGAHAEMSGAKNDPHPPPDRKRRGPTGPAARGRAAAVSPNSVERGSTRRCRWRGSHFDLVFREFVAQRHRRA
jgi:hypothetical protein